MPEGPEVFRIAQNLRVILANMRLDSMVTYEHQPAGSLETDTLLSPHDSDSREEGDGISSAEESPSEISEETRRDTVLTGITQQRYSDLFARVIGVYTKGKRAVIILDGGQSVLLTFAINGKLEFDSGPDNSTDVEPTPTSATVALLTFTKDAADEKRSTTRRRVRVVLRDPRRLASALLDRTRLILTTMLPSGFDPLQTAIGMREWVALCNLHPGNLVATFLTNQYFVAGIGNRYRSEIMHVAHIAPGSRMRDLCLNDIEILLITIGRILNAASRGEYVYTVYGRKTALLTDEPVIRAEVAKGVLVYTTAKSVISARRPKKQVSKPDAGIDKRLPMSSRRGGKGLATFCDQLIASCSGGRVSSPRERSVSPKKARKTASRGETAAGVSVQRSASRSRTVRR